MAHVLGYRHEPPSPASSCASFMKAHNLFTNVPSGSHMEAECLCQPAVQHGCKTHLLNSLPTVMSHSPQETRKGVETVTKTEEGQTAQGFYFFHTHYLTWPSQAPYIGRASVGDTPQPLARPSLASCLPWYRLSFSGLRSIPRSFALNWHTT